MLFVAAGYTTMLLSPSNITNVHHCHGGGAPTTWLVYMYINVIITLPLGAPTALHGPHRCHHYITARGTHRLALFLLVFSSAAAFFSASCCMNSALRSSAVACRWIQS